MSVEENKKLKLQNLFWVYICKRGTKRKGMERAQKNISKIPEIEMSMQ